ncbi:bifunctional phosphoribosylaminoimidazole carboxylase/phosphoribosylaminoimidazole succinocarboxamide synthetase-like isoform X1 [Ranitomeya imitator]|uniref:bifunctional phosphoribosylaminoimidazole carboxylase/phosphoribosylaminoimidazole succinocarboxamide synthetase-like isoform X1 n=1 Tax=Ranitomeya imitator TaxID=111125 RepID=UPI0037E92624
MQNIKEESMEAVEDVSKLERGVDKELRIVSVLGAREAGDSGDSRSLPRVWDGEQMSHQLEEADENIVDGNEAQVITLRNKRKLSLKENHLPLKKLLADHIPSSDPLEFSLENQATEEEAEGQNFIDHQGNYQYMKDQSEQHRYDPQTRLPGHGLFNRLSQRSRLTPGKRRKVCKVIICLPAEYPEYNGTYQVPRGKERDRLAMLGLVAKIFIQPSWNFENFRTEVITLFRQYFSCSDEEFSFNFLQCLPGNRTLIKPNVSATFKWSGIAILGLATQSSLYIRTPHALAAPAKVEDFSDGTPVPPVEGLRFAEEPYQEITKEMCTDPHQPGDSLIEPTERISTGTPATMSRADGKCFNMTNNFIFKMLREAGIKTALVRKVSENRHDTCGCELIPLIWGCWRIATGMYLTRHPDTEGRRLYPPRVEIFYKDDVLEEVVCSKEELLASEMNCAGHIIGQSEMDIINHSMVAMFEILEKACLASDFVLVNMKVQFGVDLDSKEIVLADIIDYNCWHQNQLEDVSQQHGQQNWLSPRGQGKVVVLMESVSYLVHGEKIKASCAKYSIPCELRVSSAYTGPMETLDIKSQYEGVGTPTVFITVTGRSNGLASVLSANTAYPVIHCPAVTSDWSAQDVCSALNVPENLGFCTVLSPDAAAQFSAHILGLSNCQLWSKLRSCTLNKWISVKQADEKLRDCSI